MLDIGWSELLLVAIVAIVVVGPKELPKLMRTFGVYAGKIRRAAADFRRQFDDAIAESEADEVRKNIESIRANMGTTADFDRPIDKPLMTPEPPRTALGAPHGQPGDAEPPAAKTREGEAAHTTVETVTQTKPVEPAKAPKSAPAPKVKGARSRKTQPRTGEAARAKDKRPAGPGPEGPKP